MTRDSEEALIEVLQRIAVSLSEQNRLIEKSIDISQRILAVHILNAKFRAKTAVVLNAMSVLDHKEFITELNEVK